MTESVNLSMADLDKDYKLPSKERQYPLLHLSRSNYTIHRLLKDMFTGGSMTHIDNTHYTIVDPCLVIMIHNISVDVDQYKLSESNAKPPTLSLHPVDLLRANEVGLVFGDIDHETTISYKIILPVIKAFGKPDLVESSTDYPVKLTYGDMQILIAPRISADNGIDPLVNYNIDLRLFLPEYYGIKPITLSGNQLKELLLTMDPNTTVSDAINIIYSIERETDCTR